jgi:GT2 family glycosyltransferase
MRLGIVIPFYNKWELTHKQMMQLYLNMPEWCEIYLVDDASTEEGISGGVAWWQKQLSRHRIYYIKNEENRGFGYSMNKGCKAAIKQGCDAVVLLSNDVEVYNDFATVVKNQLEEEPTILIGAELLWNDTGWNVLPNCATIPYANGWFLACTAETWKDIGGFDLGFMRFDYEDVDISLTAMMKGHKITALKPPAKLRHIGGQTVYAFYPDRMEYTRRNQQLFIEKWSGRCEEIKRVIYGQ